MPHPNTTPPSADAITHTPQQTRSAAPNLSPRTTAQIQQAYCGELAGDVTGQVFCYGYATDKDRLIYLNIGGAKTACEAIRAKLSKGQAVYLHRDDAPSLELSAGENQTGMYEAYSHSIPEARYTSLILLHDWAVRPNYKGKATTFLFRTTPEQGIAKLAHHIMHLVAVAVFPHWSEYLWQAGVDAGLLRRPQTGGGVDMWTIELDADAWTRLITGGLQKGVIQLHR